MEPTEKLVRYLSIAGRSQTFDISNIIAECIADGAVLDKPFGGYKPMYAYKMPPIFYAMFFLCPLNVVKQLKDAWWDDAYTHVDTFEPNKDEKITYTNGTRLNQLCHASLNLFSSKHFNLYDRMTEYAELINVPLFRVGRDRYNYILDNNR
jgi:hypothetical protein